MKEYLVGLDFGHGETAAWVVPVNGNTEIAPQGNSLRLTSSNSERDRQIWSVVYKEKGNVYSLELRGEASSPITELKGKPHTLSSQKKEAYKKYICLVVERLLKINQMLRWNEADNEWNFDLCVACPTSWKQDEIDEYLQFFNDALSPKNIRVLWIIKESDAAFFSKWNMAENDGCTLVIDYGSSTIDYTAVENMKKISKDGWSSKNLGASKIERVMMRPTDRDGLDEFNKKYERAQAIITETGNTHIDIDEILRLECRRAKEGLYKENKRVANVHFNLTTYIPNGPRCVFDYDFDLTADNDFGEYCKKVQRSFTEFKENLNRRVDKIILSGGACIMPWVPDVVQKVFDGARIVTDQFPQYVVAEGVALYAKAQMEALMRLKQILSEVDFADIYKKADTSATAAAVRRMLPELLNDLKSRSSVTATLVRQNFCDFIEGLNSNNVDYCRILQAEYDSLITEIVRTSIAGAVKEVFKFDVDLSDTNIHMEVEAIDWNHDLFIEDGSFYEAFTAWVVNNSNAFFGSFFFDWGKERTNPERDKIIEGTRSALESVMDGKTQIALYPDGIVQAKAVEIRRLVLEEAERVFYEKQLFKTTFSN